MELNYKKVPDIITGKDLDYLSDIFNWNMCAYKFTYDAINNVETKELVDILKEINNTYYDNLNEILDILNEKGEENEQKN